MCNVANMAEWLGVRQQESNDSRKGDNLDVPLSQPNLYPYKSLDQGRNEIRVLRTCKLSEADGLVSCTISHVSLDLNPPYEALSYTWGDNTGDAQLNKKILIDGHVVAVTRNLEAALRKLLMTEEHRVLWIDALCINQADVAERNEQVSKMKLVYQCAMKVVVWLGEEYNDSREAFRLLQSFREVGVRKSIFDRPESWTHSTILPNDIIQKIYALKKLFEREYWNRSWVLQEIAFAQRLVVYCGSDYMTWDDLRNACEALRIDANWLREALQLSGLGHMPLLLLAAGPNLFEWINYNTANQDTDLGKFQATSYPEWKDVTLSKLLVRYRIREASDPRDKVYSLLGFLPIEKQNRIPVDYSLDAYSVFQNVATFLVTEEQDLRVLAENKTSRIRLSDLDTSFYLPSWVPNWANLCKGDKLRIDMFCHQSSASGTTLLNVFVQDHNILCVQGICIGSIASAGALMPEFINEEFNFAPVFDALDDWWHIFLSTGRKDIIGENGFVNLINYGRYYDQYYISTEQAEALEKELVRYLRIVLSLHRPDDKTLLPLLGKQEGVVDNDTKRQAEAYIWSAVLVNRKRKFLVLDGVKCGIGPQCSEEGDLVVVVLGCTVPLVLKKRSEEDGGGYFNLGDAYVDGFMHGEAIRDFNDGKRVSEVFELH